MTYGLTRVDELTSYMGSLSNQCIPCRTRKQSGRETGPRSHPGHGWQMGWMAVRQSVVQPQPSALLARFHHPSRQKNPCRYPTLPKYLPYGHGGMRYSPGLRVNQPRAARVWFAITAAITLARTLARNHHTFSPPARTDSVLAAASRRAHANQPTPSPPQETERLRKG